MKLNRQSKDELRKKIIEQLKEVPEGQRVQLDKELLEDLLFEVVTLDKEKGIKVKLPVWSGEFLKKIDLSQVDFTDVSWNILASDIESLSIYYFECYGIKLDKIVISTLKKIKEDNDNRLLSSNGYVVSYVGTNSKIDLSKSFEAIHGKELGIDSCDFTGLDFSQQDLTDIKLISVYYSSLKKTNLPIGNIPFEAFGSDLSGIDLSTIEIDAQNYLSDNFSNLGACNLTGCGVQIRLHADDIKDGEEKDDLIQAMNVNWVGCYVNGKRVLSNEEKQAIATEKREKYGKMKDEIFSSTLGSVEEQVSHMKR